VRHPVVDIVLDETKAERISRSWSSVMSALSVPSHSGTAAGAATSTRPSATSNPSAAWVIDFAIDQLVSVVSAVTTNSGWKRFSGCTP
jgi:hypothetical protein